MTEMEFDDETPEAVILDGLQSKYVFARITVNVEVNKEADAETVRTGKQNQEVCVADHSSTVKITLWEEDVGILQEQSSYRRENFVVGEWGGTNVVAQAFFAIVCNPLVK